MTCKPDVLRSVPLFALQDDEETAVLASQVANLTPPRHSASGQERKKECLGRTFFCADAKASDPPFR